MGTNAEFYRSVGMTEMEVEQAYDGAWYVKGYAPEKLAEIMQQEIRLVRNGYLQETDKYMIVDYPLTEEERQKVKVKIRFFGKSQNRGSPNSCPF